MNYKKVKKDYERAAYLLGVYDILKQCGVPEKLVHYFAPFCVNSGYSLGEVTRIQCGGVLIVERDTRAHYTGCARRYNNTAVHGYTCVNFSKKALRKFVDLCAELERTRLFARRTEIYNGLVGLIREATDAETTKHKHGAPNPIYWATL